MTLATELIENYRQALRSLWNDHFWRDVGFRDWQSVRDFDQACPALFRGLVTRRLEPLAEPSGQSLFGASYRVVPNLETGLLSSILVNMQAPDTPNLSWEIIPGPFSATQVQMTLIDFFDWNVRTWRDFRYYRVKILKFENHPDLVGREGLAEVLETNVLWNVSEAS